MQEVFEVHENSPVDVKQRWDKLLVNQTSLERSWSCLSTFTVLGPTEDIEVVYLEFSGIFPVKARDVVAFKAKKTLSDGITCFSILCPLTHSGTIVGYGHTINHDARPI